MGHAQRGSWGGLTATLVALSVLLAACAQGGGRGDGGSGGPRDGSPPPRRDAGGTVDPCSELGYAPSCEEATDVGSLAPGERLDSDEGLIGAVGGAQWLRVAFPPEAPPTVEDGGVASMAGGGAPAVRFLRNSNDAYRIEIRTDCAGVAMCGEGGGPSSPGMASNITEWTFTDTVSPGEEGPGELSTRETPWPAEVYVRVYAVSDPECGTYQLEIVR